MNVFVPPILDQYLESIALNAYIRKEETSQINNLKFYLNKVVKEEQIELKASRKKEIIKIRLKINEIEDRKQ